uniref:PGG domain-containing protein n=1 Tax=Fagus sylvatica TaxID=28930 RepID=A0A2N9JC16_FAGSY
MASTIDQINPDPEMENVKKYLFKIAMQGKWEKVVEIYRTNPMAHKAKLTSETPFFLAALYGKKEAFLCLHELCGTENGYNYCRRKDGDTILHCAISGDYFVLKCVRRDAKNLKGSKDTPGAAGFNATNGARHKVFPANYGICFEFVKLASKSMLVIFGLGSSGIRKIEEKKQKHTWAVQILNELLQYSSLYEYDYTGANPLPATPQDDVGTIPYDVSDGGDINFASEASFLGDLKPKTPTADTLETKEEEKNIGTGGNDKTKEAKKKKPEKAKKESPILIAAKNGITEIVEKILELFPVAIHDMNEHKKNIVLLAVENRQPHAGADPFMTVPTLKFKKKNLVVDHKGNSALHLSAKLGDHKPWLIPGAALQIQWEIKWHEFVKDSMPFHFFPHNNKDGKTSREIFTETHSELVKEGSQWLISTSNSCSVVAALIAAVAFASSTTVPGGIKEESGTPTLENQPAFDIFAIASLVALCFSVTALVMFLSILTSRYQERDFGMDLPRKLLLGLTSLFVSIASMLISFCAGHFFVLKDKLKYAAFPVYAVTCLPITFFAIAQFPLYFDLLWAIFKKVPQRSYKVATF